MKFNKKLYFLVFLLVVIIATLFLFFLIFNPADKSTNQKKGVENMSMTDCPTHINFPLNRNEMYVLLRNMENSNKEIHTAFSLYGKNYLCLNTNENPASKNEQQNTYSSYKEIYCGNYYFVEQYHDATGPLLYGPLYDGELNISDCTENNVGNACYFIVATRTLDKKVCQYIGDNIWKEKCLMSIALLGENVNACSELSDTTKRICYEKFGELTSKTEDLCKKLDDFDSSLGDNCYSVLSSSEGSIAVCYKIKESWKKDNCLMGPVIWDYTRKNYKDLDKLDCNKISNQDDQKKCFEFTNQLD